MTKRAKRILFYSAIAIFLALSYIAILYAQGYKYNFSKGTFQRTGAVSLKVNTGARIFLNDRLAGETSFLNHAFSIDRLLPGRYKIAVQRDDYSAWHKNITIEKGVLIDFPNILILPEKGKEEEELFKKTDLLFKKLEPMPTLKPIPTLKKDSSPSELMKDRFILDIKAEKLYRNTDRGAEEIARNVKGFRLSENKNKIAWWTSNNELWILWLTDQNYQPFYKEGDKELVARFQIPIQNGAWFESEDHIILELEQTDSKGRPYSIYRVVEIDKRGGVNIMEL